MESQNRENHINALVFDDSLYQRTRGKGTELVSKIFDHNDRKIRLSYRMMTGGWTNGDTFIPFAQSLLSTKNENQMVGADVIAMIKKNGTKYTWANPETGETDKLNVKELYSRNKKRR